MSKYSEKVKRRKEDVHITDEPEDDYSVIPSASVRRYFRAKAALYGMTEKTYTALKVEVDSLVYKKLLKGRTAKLRIKITDDTAIALGEMWRDGQKTGINFWVYSTPYGGRMKVKAVRMVETHSMQVVIPELSIRIWGFNKTLKPLMKDWLSEGTVVQKYAA